MSVYECLQMLVGLVSTHCKNCLLFKQLMMLEIGQGIMKAARTGKALKLYLMLYMSLARLYEQCRKLAAIGFGDSSQQNYVIMFLLRCYLYL